MCKEKRPQKGFYNNEMKFENLVLRLTSKIEEQVYSSSSVNIQEKSFDFNDKWYKIHTLI